MKTNRNVDRNIHFAPAYVPAASFRKVPRRAREEHERFCQLRPGTKRVLQWRAYVAGVLLLAGSASG